MAILPLDVIDWRCAPARRIQVLAWQMRQLVGRGSAPSEKVLRGERPFLFCSGDETRHRAEQARAMMAPAALQLVPLSSCPALRVSALLSLVALRRAVRGQSANADAALLSVQGSALRCLVTSRHNNRGHLSLVGCRTVMVKGSCLVLVIE